MRHSPCLVCVLCVLAGAASVSKANARATWTCTAVLTEDDNYPFHIGGSTDMNSTYSESNNDAYSSAVSVARAANSTATGQSIAAGQASYKVTWKLNGSGAKPTLTVYSNATATAYVESGESKGTDIANIGIQGAGETGATTLNLHAGQSDPHSAVQLVEKVTDDGQVTCASHVHPAGSVSKNGQSFSASATFKWIAAVGGNIAPAGGF